MTEKRSSPASAGGLRFRDMAVTPNTHLSGGKVEPSPPTGGRVAPRCALSYASHIESHWRHAGNRQRDSRDSALKGFMVLSLPSDESSGYGRRSRREGNDHRARVPQPQSCSRTRRAHQRGDVTQRYAVPSPVRLRMVLYVALDHNRDFLHEVGDGFKVACRGEPSAASGADPGRQDLAADADQLAVLGRCT